MPWRASTTLFALVPLLAACSDSSPPPHLRIEGGDAGRGRALVAELGCGTCHTITAMRGARGVVGPPLDDYAQRAVLAGHLPNAPRNLIPWLLDPPALRPGTAMPSHGLSPAQARDIATYLYTLGAANVAIYPPDPPLDLVPETGADSPAAALARGAARP